MINRMAEVAKMLSVKLEEVFFIEEQSKLYLKFTENGLRQSFDRVSWTSAADWVWGSLIKGNSEINRLPWKPKMGEVYYIPFIHYSDSSRSLKTRWRGDNADNKLYQLGIVCGTREEAVALTKRMLAVAKEK